MKKLLALTMVVVMVVLMSPVNANAVLYMIQEQRINKHPKVAKSDIKLFVEKDEKLNKITDNIIIIGDGVSYLQVKSLCNALDLKVDWNGQRREINITKDKSIKEDAEDNESGKLKATISDITLFVNGEQLLEYVIIINGRSYLPLRAISEALELEVEWDGIDRTITVK